MYLLSKIIRFELQTLLIRSWYLFLALRPLKNCWIFYLINIVSFASKQTKVCIYLKLFKRLLLINRHTLRWDQLFLRIEIYFIWVPHFNLKRRFFGVGYIWRWSHQFWFFACIFLLLYKVLFEFWWLIDVVGAWWIVDALWFVVLAFLDWARVLICFGEIVYERCTFWLECLIKFLLIIFLSWTCI